MTYRAPIRESGWKATLGSVFRRRYRDVPAVQDVSFALRPGEVVGFIGLNGAGKTTTMKILSGLLHASPVMFRCWVAPRGSAERSTPDRPARLGKYDGRPDDHYRVSSAGPPEASGLPPERTITASGEYPLPAYRRRWTDPAAPQRACVVDYRPGAP